jgi:hypothetical protein
VTTGEAQNRARHRPWRLGGSAHRREHNSDHGVARGAASEHRETERVGMHAKTR